MRDLEKDFLNILDTAGWISGAYAEWLKQTSCFPLRFIAPLPPPPQSYSQSERGTGQE